MITKFKLFESNIPYDEDDLAYLFPQKYVEEYFNDGYEINAEEASRGLNLWHYVKDKDKVADDLIKDAIKEADINNERDFDKNDFCQYILENMLTSVMPELDKFRKKYVLGPIEYEEILRKMDRDTLMDLVIKKGKENDFITNYYEEKWSDWHPEKILEDKLGKHTIREDLYNYLFHYVDDNEIINDYIERIDFETKFEYLRDSISTDYKLQKDLLEINIGDKKNGTRIRNEKFERNIIEALFDIMDSTISIGTTYDFQKLYIQTNVEQEDPEDADEITAYVIKQINDKFGLETKIEKEYRDFTYLIDSEKYNV